MNYIVFVLLLFFFACAEQNNNYTTITGFDSESKANGKDIKFDSLDIVHLELNRNSVFSRIVDVEILDSVILVQDDERLVGFSRSGKYLCNYGSKGRGAGEYVRIFSYFVSNDTVSIIDDFSQKIINYDLHGNYINTRRYDKNIFGLSQKTFKFTGDKILSVNYLYNDKNTIYSIIEGCKETVPLYEFPVNTDNTMESIGKHPISFFKDKMLTVVPFDNRVYVYDDEVLKPQYLVATDMNIIDKNKLKSIKNFSVMSHADFMNEGYFMGFSDIFETDKYILMSYKNMYYFLVDKNTMTGKKYDYSYNVQMNDSIVSLPILNLISVADNNSFVGYLSSGMQSERISKCIMHNTNDKLIKKLKTAVDVVLRNDSYCLLLYDIK